MTLFQVFDIPVFWPILVLYVAIPFNPICTLYFSCFFFRFSSSSVPPPPPTHPCDSYFIVLLFITMRRQIQHM